MKHVRLFLLLCIAFLSQTTFANHLVGGEFQITYQSNFTYQIQLNVYGDAAGLNGPQGNEDQFVDVATFSKQTNQMVEAFRIPISSTFFVPYVNLQCKNASIQTKVLQYRLQKYLAPALYSNPNGYYIVWDRCCRNSGIANIQQPNFAGFVFYAEFPAVTKNAAAFINSSPVLPPMPPDILCVQELYQYSLQATDADGDQLVYELSEPMYGSTDQQFPIQSVPNPAPYRPVIWQPGYGLANMIPGSPALNINATTGLLSVRPQNAGLYVFAVTISEFRNNVKIGEVRRDIQVKVTACQSNQKPKLSLRLPGATQDYQEGDTLFVTDATDYCYPFSFSDSNLGQTITLEVVPVNFAQKPVITPASGTIAQAGQTLTGQICWADCNVNSPNTLYKVNLIARDNACGNAGTDTLELTYLVVPKPNAKPVIVTQNLVNNEASAQVGQTLNFNLLSTDSDQDDLVVSMEGVGFNAAALSMNLTSLTGKGEVRSGFSWTPACEQFLERTEYDLRFKVKDNSCFTDHIDTVLVKVWLAENPDLVEFLPPNIFTPNGDGFNDKFVMPTLPKDKCNDVFMEIRIFSRWGHQVYDSKDRNFAWNGKNISDGVYYYRVKFEKKTYKGYVTIVR
ncbi:gliding motility-associated C-terminal domain-containing protein [Adhaeribacter terreus]|uniref:Gliding motility-associated C-terminal domain-containing protein n=1 Tax=Adhaeribacter terreus TaxID=529703 RepID=A0ABW0EG22_9BACT